MTDFFPYLVMTELLGLEGSGILTRALDDLEPEVRPEMGTWWEKAPGFGRLTLEFTLPDGVAPDMAYPLVQDAVVGAVEMGITGEDILGIVRMSEVETLLQREQLRMTGIYTAEPIVLGGSDFFINYLDGLREVTAEDVQRVLTNWLVDAPCQAVMIEPDPAKAEDEGGMGGMPPGMKMPAGMKMPPAMAAAMKKQQAGGSEEAEAKPAPAAAPAVLNVDRSVLASGAVLVSQTNPASPLSAIHLTVRGRSVIDRDNAAAGALDLVHRLMTEGIPGCDKVCLSRRLRDLGAQVKLVDDGRIPMDNYYTNGRFSFIRIETAAEYGPEVLDLLMTVIQHATFDDKAFEQVRQDRIKEMGRHEASARSTANTLLDEALFGEHPLVLPAEGDAETLAAIDFNQARAVYRKAFAPENLIFSIVGPASHEDLKRTLEKELGGEGAPTVGPAPVPVTAASETLTATVGGQMTAIRLGTIMEVDKADADALKLVVAILSDRMAMDLREARGLSYSVGASLEVHGERGRFTSWINPPSERMDEGLTALKEFIAGFDATTVTQDEMDKIRAARSGRMMMRRLSSMGQAYYLAMAELEGDIGGYLNGLKAYEELTLADLQAAATKYLSNMIMVEVVVD
jgi:predicted Zn-dependent peptidase